MWNGFVPRVYKEGRQGKFLPCTNNYTRTPPKFQEIVISGNFEGVVKTQKTA